MTCAMLQQEAADVVYSKKLWRVMTKRDDIPGNPPENIMERLLDNINRTESCCVTLPSNVQSRIA